MGRLAVVAALVIATVSCRRKTTNVEVETKVAPAPETDAGAPPPKITGLCHGGWCFEDPLPTGEDLVDVVTGGPNDAVIATSGARTLGSSLIHWDGKQFTSTDVAEHVTALHRTGAHDVWATTREGVLLHGDGRTWAPIESGHKTPLNSIWGDGAGSLFAVGDDGVILHYNGATWARAPSPGTERLRVVRGRARNDVWAAGDGVILHFDGTAWTVAHRVVPGARAEKVPTGGFCGTPAAMANEHNNALTRVTALAVLGPTDVLAAAGVGRVLHFDGTTWREDDLHSKGVNALTSFYATSPLNAYAVGGHSIVRWDGTQWSVDARDESEHFAAVHGSDAKNVWIVGALGSILRGSGDKFDRLGTRGARGRVTSAYIGVEDAFAIGEAQILRRQAGAWTRSTAADDLLAIGGSSDKDVWAVGFKPVGLRWNGTDWREDSARAGMHRLRATAPDDIWAIGNDLSHWDGKAWKLVDAKYGLLDLWTPTRGVVFAVGKPRDTSGMTIYKGDADLLRWIGSGWTKVATIPDYVSGIGGSAPNDIYVAGTYDVFHFDGKTVSVAYKDAKREGYPGDRTVIVRSASDITVAGHGGALHFDGVTWTQQDAPMHGALFAGGPLGLFAFGPSGGIARRTP